MILEKNYYSPFGLIKGPYQFIKVMLLTRFINKVSSKKSIESSLISTLGIPLLLLDDKGKELCTHCDKCIEVCPTKCIEIGKNSLTQSSLEILKCIYCSLCVDVCDDNALTMEHSRRFVGHGEDDWIIKGDSLVLDLRSEQSEEPETSADQAEETSLT